MSQLNVLTKFSYSYLLILIGIAFSACKNHEQEVTDLFRTATVIKFDIPKNKINDIGVGKNSQNMIHIFLKKKYPKVDNFTLIHCQKMNDTIDYFEYECRLINEYYVFFVFQNCDKIEVKGIKSNILPNRDTRYEMDNKNIDVYKKVGEFTLNASYQFDKGQIHFTRDDRFSIWE